MCSLVLHARAHHGSLGLEEGHCLTLHIGAHQRAVSVVVLQEWYHCCSDGHQLLGGYVHVVGLGGLYFDYLVQPSCNDPVLGKPHPAVLVGNGRLVCLSHYVVVLLVGGEVNYLVAYALVLPVHLAVGRLDKAVAVYAGIGGKGVYKAYVRAFRGLYGAHAAVMGIVNVSNFECGALTVQAPGSQGGQPALMGKLRKGVCLVHKLGQLG